MITFLIWMVESFMVKEPSIILITFKVYKFYPPNLSNLTTKLLQKNLKNPVGKSNTYQFIFKPLYIIFINIYMTNISFM